MDVLELRQLLDAVLTSAQDTRDSEDFGSAWNTFAEAVEEQSLLQTDAALLAELVLARPGVLEGLVDSIKAHGKQAYKTREKILKWLTSLIEQLGPDKATQYASALLSQGTLLFKSEENVGPRTSALDIITLFLDWQLDGLLQPGSLVLQPLHDAKALQRVYQTERSMRPTLKGAVLGVLGLLLRLAGPAAETDVLFNKHWLSEECHRVLQASTATAATGGRGRDVGGALSGMAAAMSLMQPTEGLDIQAEAYALVVDMIRTAAEKEKDSSYAGPKSALHTLSTCAGRFGPLLLRDADVILSSLGALRAHHMNKGMRDAAGAALKAVFSELAVQLSGLNSGALSVAERIQKLESLVHSMTLQLASGTGGQRLVRVMVQGIEYLTPAIGDLLGEQGLRTILASLMPLIQKGPLLERLEDLQDGRVDTEVMLLHALSALLVALPGLHEAALDMATTVAERILGVYLELWPKQRPAVHAALLQFLVAVASKGAATLTAVVTRLVTLLVSYTVKPLNVQVLTGPLTVMAEGEEPPAPWQMYVELWKALLLRQDVPQDVLSRLVSRFGQPTIQSVQDAVYDGLIRATLDALRNLNLSYHLATTPDPDQQPPSATAKLDAWSADEQEALAAELGSGLVAGNPHDMNAFIQLSAFISHILPAVGPAAFSRWAYILTVELVTGASYRPLLSGFYRMLTATMKLCAAAGLLDGESKGQQQRGVAVQISGVNVEDADVSPMQIDAVASHVCVLVYKEFLQDVLVACRRYKDELLCACLELLLAAPPSVMNAHAMVIPLGLALNIGLQYPPVAKLVVNTLESWETHQPDNLKEVLPSILPLMDPYMRDLSQMPSGDAGEIGREASEGVQGGDGEAVRGADGEASGDTVGFGGASVAEEGRAFLAQARARANAARRKKEAAKQGLLALQPRLQLWLGRMGGAVHYMAVATDYHGAASGSEGRPAATAAGTQWGTIKRVGILTPFPDLKEPLMVWLDPVLPQVIALAESDPNRASRVAACEFLHAITLWMVGVNARRPLDADEILGGAGGGSGVANAKPTPFHNVMRNMFPALLRLAAGPESVARQLFVPLLESLVHWLTRSARREGAEAMSLLDAIMDGLCDEGSGSMRELSAKLLAEFMKWSAKHVPDDAGVNFNAVSLLRRLFDRLAHPQPYQRLGAALAMGQCARVMPAALCEQYFLEALQNCMHALRLADADAAGHGTVKQVKHAISALITHCLPRCIESIKQEDTKRRGTFSSLNDFLSWLWPHTAAPERHARHTAQLLHDRLSEELFGDGSAMQVDGQGFSAKWLASRYDGNTSAREKELENFLLLKRHLPDELFTADSGTGEEGAAGDGGVSVADMRLWLRALESSVDWTTWAMEQKMLDPFDLQWLLSRSESRANVVDGTAQLLALLPDLEHIARAAAEQHQKLHEQQPPTTTAFKEVSEEVAEDVLGFGAATGVFTGCDDNLREASLAVAELLTRLLGTGLVEMAVAKLGTGSNKPPGIENFCMIGLMVPGVLGFRPAEVEGRRRLAAATVRLLQEASSRQPDVMVSLQKLLNVFVEHVVLPHLTGGSSSSSSGDVTGLVTATGFIQGLSQLLNLPLPPGVERLPPAVLSALPECCITLVTQLVAAGSTARPQQLMAATDALQLALQLGLPHQRLLQLLLQHPSGPNLYESFNVPLQCWLLFNAQQCMPALKNTMSKLAGPGAASSVTDAGLGLAESVRVAEQLVLGTLQSLQRRKAVLGRQDVNQGTFIDAILKNLTILQPLVTQGAPLEAKSLFLRLLSALLSLDATAVLSQLQPSFRFVLQSYQRLLSSTDPREAGLKSQALQLLGTFYSLPSEVLFGVSEAVQTVVDSFGVENRSQDRSSAAAIQYAKQLMSIMDAAVATAEAHHTDGCIKLVELLLPELLKMGKGICQGGYNTGHLYQEGMEARLAVVAAAAAWRHPPAPAPPQQQLLPSTGPTVSAPSPTTPTKFGAPAGDIAVGSGGVKVPAGGDGTGDEMPLLARMLLDYCWGLIFEQPNYQVELRMALTAYLLVPLLELAPPALRVKYFAGNVQKLLSTAETGGDRFMMQENLQLGAKWSAYRLLECMYRTLTKDELEAAVNQLPGKNQSLIKQAVKDIRELEATDPHLQDLARLVQAAAFNVTAALLRATQSNAKFYAPAFQGKNRSVPGEIWAQLVDVRQQLRFTVETPRGGRARLRRSQAAVKAVQDHLRAGRAAAASGTQIASLGGFDPSVASLAAKVSASQYGISATGGFRESLTAELPATGAEPSAAAAAAGQPSQTQTLESGWQDPLLMTDKQPAGARAVAAAAADVVMLREREKDVLLTYDDELDVHPAMLPLVQLMERAAELPSDVQGGMPAWQQLVLTALNDSNAPMMARLFLVKAIMHMESRLAAIQAEYQQQQQQQVEQGIVEEQVSPAPTSIFAEHADAFFPALVSVVLPPAGPTETDIKYGAFHYLLRDMALVFLGWKKLFQRGPGGVLAYGDQIQSSAEMWLRHLVMVAAGQSDVMRVNYDYIRAFMAQWGSKVLLTGEELLVHLPPPATARPGTSAGSSTAAATFDSRRSMFGLQLLATALAYGQTKALMKGPKGVELWRRVKAVMSGARVGLRLGDRLGTVIGVILTGLDRLERQDKQAGSSTTPAGTSQADQQKPAGQPGSGKAGGKAGRVKDREITKDLVELETEDQLRVMYGAHKFEGLLCLLERASAYYPSVVDACRSWVLSSITLVEGKLRDMALELLRRRAGHISGLFQDLLNQNMQTATFGYSRSPGVQVKALQVLAELLPMQPPREAVAAVVQLVPHFVKHPVKECRLQALRMLRDAWQVASINHQSSDVDQTAPGQTAAGQTAAGASAAGTSAASQPSMAAMQQEIENALFVLLCDDDLQVRHEALTFWHGVLPISLGPRIQALLTRMSAIRADSATPDSWKTSSEAHWSQSAAALLLRLPKDAHGFDSPMFRESLAECEFRDYSVDTQLGTQGAGVTMGMTPLFTQQATLSADDGDGDAVTFTQGAVAATAGGAAATQGTASSSTQARSPVKAGAVSRAPGLGLVRATQVGGYSAYASTIPLSMAAEATETMTTATGTQQPDSSLSLPRATLRRRVGVKPAAGGSSAAFAMLRRRAAAERQAAERAKRITLYRQYRVGELPDIQSVTLSGLILPLTVMCDRHTTVSGLVVRVMEAAVVDATKTAQIQEQVLHGVRAALHAAFSSSPQHPAYVSTLQGMAAVDRGIWIEPMAVAAAAHASGGLQAAVAQLEEQMMFSESTASTSAQASTSARTGKVGSSSSGLHPLYPPLRANTEVWQLLAELYQQLQEEDVLAVIRTKHIIQCPGTVKALSASSHGRHSLALSIYEQLLDAAQGTTADEEAVAELLAGCEQPSPVEEGLWYDDRMTCLQVLGKWGVIEEQIEADLTPEGADATVAAPALDRLFRDPHREVQGYLRPYVKACLFQPTSRQRLGTLLCVAETHRQWLNKMQEVAGVELSAFEVIQGNLERARNAVSATLRAFRERWTGGQSTSSAWRHNCLDMLQPLAEIDEVLQLLQPTSPVPRPEAVRQLTSRWSQRATDAANHVDFDCVLTVLNVRSVLLDAMHAGLQGADHQAVVSVSQSATADLQLQAAQSLSHQGFLDGAESVLAQRAARLVGRPVKEQLPGLLAEVSVSVAQLKSEVGLLKSDEGAVRAKLGSELLNLRGYTWGKSKNTLASLQLIQALTTEAAALITLAEMTQAAAAAATATAELAGIAAATVAGSSSSTDPRHAWVSVALQDYATALRLQQQQKSQQATAELASEAAAVALQFGLLCNRLLQGQVDAATGAATAAVGSSSLADISLPHLTNEAQALISSGGGLGAIVVKHIMQAMSSQSSVGNEARLFLPTVLSVMGGGDLADLNNLKGAQAKLKDNISTGACAVFEETWRGVPLGVYLPWISQMLSRLGDSEGKTLLTPLEELAARYPQRVYLPYHLSARHWSAVARSRAAHLGAMLSGPAVGDLPAFVDALDELTYPLHRWASFEAEIVNALSQVDVAEAVRVYREEAYPNLIGRYIQSDAGTDRGHTRTINSKFAHNYKDAFKAVFGEDGSKIPNLGAAGLKAAAAKLLKKHAEEVGKLTEKRQLTDFSKWFQEFTDNAGVVSPDRPPLLLPVMPSVYGSSSGSDQQDLDHPVAIVGFGKLVDVYASKQKPKKITIYCDDFRSHDYVAKGGEDVRIDERIEQLFRVMSGLAGTHSGCTARGLNTALRTFDVVPMLPRLGILEFVEGTTPLEGAMVPSTIPPADVEAASNAYVRLISGSSQTHGEADYDRAYARKNSEMVAAFDKIQSMVRWDGLREALLLLATSPEVFLAHRDNYMRSLSATSAFGWLAGVGDRHPQNFLLEKRTGAIVPIDFGYSFGTAVMVLPVPELAPFRLTRQLQCVLQPHDAKAVLQAIIAAALSAMQEHKQVLESILAVFLREPLLEWQKEAVQLSRLEAAAAAAKGKSKAAQAGAGSSPSEAHITLKLDFTRRRLAGHHPSGITLGEARLRHGHKAVWPALEALIKGDVAAGDARAGLPLTGPLPGGAQQVALCLIDQATDVKILSRAWTGWKPWM